MDLNKWTVTGRLTRDPKDISKGESKVVILSLATNYRDKVAGEWVDKVLYVEGPVFGKTAENCLAYLAKGSRVLLVGRAGIKTWESEGKHGASATIHPEQVMFLDKKGGGGTEDGSAPF